MASKHSGELAGGFAFGAFELTRDSLELRRKGMRLALPEQSAKILLLLLERAGRVVSRDELREELWGEGVHVDFEHSLNNAVNRLRRVLGDSAKDARFIETLQSHGYRFTAPVRVLRSGTETGVPGAASLDADPQGDAAKKLWRPLRTMMPISLAVLVLLAAVVALTTDFSDQGAFPLTRDGDGRASFSEATPASRPSKPEAYEAYLRGRYFWQRRAEGGFYKALEELEKAAALDPAWAPVQELLAQIYVKQAYWSLEPPASALRRAESSARLALQGDKASAQAHTVLARTAMALEWNWEKADRHLSQALELGPQDAEVHLWRAEFLAVRGRHDLALAEVERARSLEPESISTHAALGWHLYVARRYGEAIQHLQKTLAMQPENFLAAANLGWALLAAGRPEEAREAFLRGTRYPDNPPSHVLAGLACTRAAQGRRKEAEELLGKLQERVRHAFVAQIHFAQIFALLGRDQEALDQLRQAFRDHVPWLRLAAVDPVYDPLRKEAGFQRLMADMGLEAAQEMSPDLARSQPQ
ncbi:MAG TPA: winged helix-turn-helix domain-containing protein [Acidobacteriota bacterium]|nr:winged helix-turn-helix domain-containing protein [Acidobacteriota bacterium]